MRVLGIDPGLATTGYAILDHIPTGKSFHSELKMLEHGVVSTPAGESLQSRLRTIFNDINALIDEYNPEALAVEELFFAKNVTTGMAVSQARGVVLLAGSHLPMEVFTPLQVKKQICGHGRAKKPQIQAMVKSLLKLSEIPRPDDAADALAVALCYMLRYKAGLVSIKLK
jgi:crossover junction endodeoxyribonuclease RuvC